MTPKSYLRIPRVPRLEYLVVVLRGVRDGYDREEVRRRVQQIREAFEEEKATALGKKKPRAVSGAFIVTEGEKMASQLGLIARTTRGWGLTLVGVQLLEKCPESFEGFPSDEVRQLLVRNYWRAYPRLGQILLGILSQPSGTVELPMKGTADNFREVSLESFQIECDLLTFYMVRELGTQLGLLNWYVVEERKQRLQRVYAIACMARLSDFEKLAGQLEHTQTPIAQCVRETGLEIGALAIEGAAYRPHTLINRPLLDAARERGYLVIEMPSDCAFVKWRGEVGVVELERVLWEIYLKMVNYRPRFPVLYSDLRNEVCHRLRVSDKAFDQLLLRLIEKPQRLQIFPSGGTLDYASNLAHLYKYLPPKTSHGHFIIYLKIDRAN